MAAAVLAAMLGGCANLGGASVSERPQISSIAAAPKATEFPAPGSARWARGAFPDLVALRTVREGIARDHLRQLIGAPHFSAGLFGVADWDYLFHFHSTGSTVVTCQYKVRFGNDQRVVGHYWKTANCAALVEPPLAVIALAAPRAQEPYKIALSTDSLFSVNGSAVADVLPEGRKRLAQLAGEIHNRFRSVDGILVIGHTDRLGSESRSDALSLGRARAVRELLVQAGVDPKLVRTRGDGERFPLVDCPGAQQSSELLQCLQPNRRMEFEISGIS